MFVREMKVSYTVKEGGGCNAYMRKISKPEDVIALVRDMVDDGIETIKCFYLDHEQRIIASKHFTNGTANNAVAFPREIFKHGLLCDAHSFVVVHNHPSGHVEPSGTDEVFTTQLCEHGEYLGMSLAEHIIIGKDLQDGKVWAYSFKNKKTTSR